MLEPPQKSLLTVVELTAANANQTNSLYLDNPGNSSVGRFEKKELLFQCQVTLTALNK